MAKTLGTPAKSNRRNRAILLKTCPCPRAQTGEVRGIPPESVVEIVERLLRQRSLSSASSVNESLRQRVVLLWNHMEILRMAPTKEEVFEKVRDALVDALGVDEEEVTTEATMVGDLGAESIDFLDIVFRLEKSFEIEIPRSELFPEDILTNAEYVQDGRVTEAGVAQLKERMPFLDLTRFEENPAVQEFSNMLTVNDLCRYVESKVGATE